MPTQGSWAKAIMLDSARSGLLTPLFALGELAVLLYQLTGLNASLGTIAAIPESERRRTNASVCFLPSLDWITPCRISRWPLAFFQSLAEAPLPSLPNHDSWIERARTVEALGYSTLAVDDHVH